ncbi:MAG: GxGYxYP family putative glycoside hydrolase, partial [Planctomycetota bacterium]|nr:GxGYxYP family putative glycoside hydrolase [Planctomycetota bacterium]
SKPLKDEYLYLFSKFDTDGFAPRGSAGQGDFDGQGSYFPDTLLPRQKTIAVHSARFGEVVFLRPKLATGDKNMLACRGQTIRVRTTKVFNVLFTLGAAHHGQHGGWVEFRFADGSTARAPFGLSDWFQEPAYGEEVAFRGTYTAPRGRTTTSRTTTSRGPIHLWLQRTPVPVEKRITAITLPDLPNAKIIGLSLGRRDGVSLATREATAAPEPAPVAIFSEEGFPYFRSPGTLSPERIQTALERAGIVSRHLSVAHLKDPNVLSPERFPVLVLPYGNTFPVAAEGNLRRYRQGGGATVHSGVPFTQPVEENPYGGWIHLGHTNAHLGFQDDKGLGVGGFVSVAPARLLPRPELEAWGLGGLPWERYRERLAYITGGVQVLNPKSFPEGTRVIPLIGLERQAAGPLAAVVIHGEGAFRGCIDVWTSTMPIWFESEGRHTALHLELVVRGTAWCLKEKKKIGEEEWRRIARPVRPEELRPSTRETPEGLGSALPTSLARRGTVRWVALKGLSPAERVLLASAQGLLHQRAGHSLYLAGTDADRGWLNFLQGEKYFDKVQKLNVSDVFSLLGHRRAVVVDPDVYGSLNLATMVAAVEGLLVAYPGVVDRHGLEVAFDLRGTFESGPEMVRWALENLRPSLDPGLLASYPPTADTWRVRDYLIARKIFTFWVPSPYERSGFRASAAREQELVSGLLAETPLMTPVIGRLGTAQRRGVGSSVGRDLLARHGKFLVRVSDIANLSLSSGIEARKKPAPATESNVVKLERDKVYVSYATAVASLPALGNLEGRYRVRPRPSRTGASSTTRGATPLATAAATSRGAPRSKAPRPSSLDPAVSALLPVHVGLYVETTALEPPTGSAWSEPIDLESFGAAFGDRGQERALDALAGTLARRLEIGARKYLTIGSLEGDSGRLERLLGKLPAESGVFAGYRASARRGVLDALEMVGDVPVFHDVGAAELQPLLVNGEVRDLFRPLFPLFLYTTESVYRNLERRGQLGDHVVVVRPAELVSLARRSAERRRFERLDLVRSGSTWKYHDRG